MRSSGEWDVRTSAAFPLTVGLAFLLGVVVLVHPFHLGADGFFRSGDPIFFRAVAHDPFGDGRAIRRLGLGYEASYRYGRIGFPILGWLLALGHPAWVTTTMAVCHLVAIAAIPVLAMVLLEQYGASPFGGLSILLLPGLLLLGGHAYAEPLLAATLLAGFVLEARGRRTASIATFAFAALVKETAIIAVVGLVLRAAWRRDWVQARAWCYALVPYAVWSTWVRFRVGELPFAAKDPSRSNALSAPFVGMVDALRRDTPNAALVAVALLATVAVAAYGAWSARGLPIAAAAGLFAVFTTCTGPNTTAYSADTLRILIVPQILGLLCLAYAWSRRRQPVPAIA